MPAGFFCRFFLAEGVGLIGEMSAKDNRVRPDFPDEVGREVRLPSGLEASPARERRKRDVVLADLPPRLMTHATDLAEDLSFALVARHDRLCIQVVGSH